MAHTNVIEGVFSVFMRLKISSPLSSCLFWVSVMAKPFFQSRLKLQRAEMVLSELRASFDSYMSRTPAIITEQVVGEYVQHAITINELPPKMISPMIGDVIHNLRAALDLLACECVRINGKSDEKVYFPFCDDPAFLDDMIKNKKLDRASPAVIDLVKNLKPYKGGNQALRAVHDLDIQDKHSAIIPSLGLISGPGMAMTLSLNDTLLGTIAGGEAMIRDGVEGRNGTFPLPIKLVFPAMSPFDNLDVFETLHRLNEEFSRIVDSFELCCFGTISK